jgi:hypothetical protein
VVTPTPTLAPIIITEVFPKPSQGEEWVELYNPNSTTANLSGWELWDELSQPSLIFSFTTQTIGSNQWLIVPITRKLNDTEDGVTLKTNTGQMSDAMHYTSSEPDKSWARLGSTNNSPWSLGAASPAEDNPIPTPTPTTQPTSNPTPDPTATTTPTKTPTLSPTNVLVQNPTITITTAQKVLNLSTPLSLAAPSLTPSPAPTKIPQAPTPIPTISLEKPPSTPLEEKTKNPTLPNLLYVGLLLIQLSSLGMSLTKQGMIKTDALAPIP